MSDKLVVTEEMLSTMPPIGIAVDLYNAAKKARLAKEKEIEALKKEEDDAEQYILAYFHANGMEGAKGKEVNAVIKRNKVVTFDADDPEAKSKFFDFMLETRDPQMVQARPSVTHCRELIESGVEVPGIKMFETESVSLTTIKRR